MSVAICLPVAVSQSMTSLPLDPDAISVLSGENAIELIVPICPLSVAMFRPVETSHSWIALSASPVDAIFVLSGRKHYKRKRTRMSGE